MSLIERINGFREGLNNSVYRAAWEHSSGLADLLVSEVRMPRLRHAALGAAMYFMVSCGGSGGGHNNGYIPPVNPPPATYQCNNLRDDDNDGYTDMADIGCSSTTDNNEADHPLYGIDIVLDSPQKDDAIVGHPVDFNGTGHSDGYPITESRIDYSNDGSWDEIVAHNSTDITDFFQSTYPSAATWTAKYQIKTSDGRTATATLDIGVSPNGVPYITGLDLNNDGIAEVVDADGNGVGDGIIQTSAGAPFPYHFKIISADPDGDPLTPNGSNLPTNMSLNGDGVITFDPTPDQVGNTYTPGFNVTDGIDTSLGMTFQFEVVP